ncbi:hypothetical protein B296_00055282 [Ensete ventricosum]|uniref:Secreted protein n=1 Tax=Ensete ventricosum TaxID=4639 RepID=A0A426X0P8_ENSVE|nr:hypothetical protein B296_00055282 [Ensete ventricosum]
MSWYRRGGSSFVHRSLHWMKALVISIWGLYTTEEEVQVQVPVSPMEGDVVMLMIKRCWELHFGGQCNGKKGCGFQGVNTMVPQRWVFRVCASKLASDESLGHQHMGGCLDCFRAHIRLREPNKSEDKAEWSKGARKRRRIQRGAQLPKSKASVRKEVDWRSTTVPQRQIYQSRRKG